MKIVALIPAWNEAGTITEVVRACEPWADIILVIDDGSSDNTARLARAAGADVIRHHANRGKGEALRTGFSSLHDRTELIAVIDADLQYNPKDAPRLLEPLKNGRVDFVMGARDWTSVPLRHRIGNLIWRTLFNLLFGTRLPDTNCGFIALTSSAASKLGYHGGYIIENSMLADAVRNGLRIASVPVSVEYKHKSTISRGLRMVAGVLIFIFIAGVRWRLGRLTSHI